LSFVPDTQNKEFQDALNLIQYTRQSVFLTGKAGTGKSTFLKYICANTKKKHVVLAPTGIAAINAGGSTLHSFFKLPFYPLLPDDPNFSLQRGRIHEFFKYTKPHRKLLEVGAHCRPWNRCSIGICYEGGLDADGRPADTRTPEQTEQFILLLMRMVKIFPGVRIRGHRDMPGSIPKACPCFDAEGVFGYLER